MNKQLTLYFILLTFSITANSIAQVINVKNSTELIAALAKAQAGQTITLADGVYSKSGGFSTPKNIHGTSTSPITITGSAKAIITSNSITSGNGLTLTNNNYWVLDGFTVYNSKKGIVTDNSHHCIIKNIRVIKIGDEAIHLRTYSSFNTITRCYIDSTGTATASAKAGYAEGIYIGSANSNWPTYTSGNPDTCNYNQITYNTFGNSILSENIDIKEGTQGGTVAYNQFNGKGCNGNNSADSWIDVKGNHYKIACNTGQFALKDGFQTHIEAAGWGNYNSFSNNTIDIGASGYGIFITKSSSKGTAANNKVCNNNVVTNAASGISNIATTNCNDSCELITTLHQVYLANTPVMVFPNPFDNMLQVNPSSSSILQLELFDLQGKKIKQENHKSDIDTSELINGYYVLKITFVNHSVKFFKVIKNN